MKFDPHRHNCPFDFAQGRRSIRLKEYDYSQAGAYFVTMVAWQRECLFGDVVGDDVVLNEYGRIVRDEWEQTAVVRPNVELGTFIVMPNHVHGILVFVNDGAHTVVGATRRVAPTKTTLQSGSLGAVMAQFKFIVTKQINLLRDTPGHPVWQRNYGACPELVEGNASSATKAKWTASTVISNRTPPCGRTTMKTRPICLYNLIVGKTIQNFAPFASSR